MEALLEERAGIVEDPRGLAHYLEDGSKILCTPIVTEEILAISFLRWSSEGLINRIFNESPGTLTSFISKLYSDKVQMLAFLKEDMSGSLSPLGLGWINDRTVVGDPQVFTKAEVGIGFFRKVNPRDTLWCGRMTLQYCFDNIGLDVVNGMISVCNKPSIKYAASLGLNVSSNIPCSTIWKDKDGNTSATDSVIVTMTSIMWDNRDWR